MSNAPPPTKTSIEIALYLVYGIDTIFDATYEKDNVTIESYVTIMI